jgi:hypothetical protein
VDKISEQSKKEFWDEFTKREHWVPGATEKRLEKLKRLVWYDDDFWFHSVIRFNPGLIAPSQLNVTNEFGFKSGLANFWGMLVEKISKKEHLNPNHLPYLKPTVDKKPEKVGKIRI